MLFSLLQGFMNCTLQVYNLFYIQAILKENTSIVIGIYYACVYLANFIVILINFEYHSIDRLNILLNLQIIVVLLNLILVIYLKFTELQEYNEGVTEPLIN